VQHVRLPGVATDSIAFKDRWSLRRLSQSAVTPLTASSFMDSPAFTPRLPHRDVEQWIDNLAVPFIARHVPRARERFAVQTQWSCRKQHRCRNGQLSDRGRPRSSLTQVVRFVADQVNPP